MLGFHIDLHLAEGASDLDQGYVMQESQVWEAGGVLCVGVWDGKQRVRLVLPPLKVTERHLGCHRGEHWQLCNTTGIEQLKYTDGLTITIGIKYTYGSTITIGIKYTDGSTITIDIKYTDGLTITIGIKHTDGFTGREEKILTTCILVKLSLF